MTRSRIVGPLAGTIALVSATQAAGQPLCRPVLAVGQVQMSAMQPPTLQRKWTAVVSVDASPCATIAGSFEIGFSRLKENGPEFDFHEPFRWRSPAVQVSVDFAPDEAVQTYWLDYVAPCPCLK